MNFVECESQSQKHFTTQNEVRTVRALNTPELSNLNERKSTNLQLKYVEVNLMHSKAKKIAKTGETEELRLA